MDISIPWKAGTQRGSLALEVAEEEEEKVSLSVSRWREELLLVEGWDSRPVMASSYENKRSSSLAEIGNSYGLCRKKLVAKITAMWKDWEGEKLTPIPFGPRVERLSVVRRRRRGREMNENGRGEAGDFLASSVAILPSFLSLGQWASEVTDVTILPLLSSPD